MRLFLSLIFAVAALPANSGQVTCPESSTIISDSLRVVSLNLAHGRKDARNQVFLKGETIRTNLLEIANLMDRSGAHVIALQEADAESAWSGRFDHVALLAGNSNYACYVHGVHAASHFYDFGTALLSPHAFDGSFSHSFEPTPPTTTKGFSVAALKWAPGDAAAEPVRVIFVSVHLDFSRRSVRRAQIDDMVSALSKLDRPMVLMGDFNTDWQTEDSSLVYLAEALDLRVYEPHAEGLSTYGDKGARLDWILISPELEFKSYRVVPEVVSDHYAVAADLVLVSEE